MEVTKHNIVPGWLDGKLRGLTVYACLLLGLFALAAPSSAEAQSGAHGLSYRSTIIGTTRQLWTPRFSTGLPVSCVVHITALFDLNGQSPASSSSATWGTVEIGSTFDLLGTGNGAQGAYAQPTHYTQYWKATQTSYVKLPAFSSVRFGCLAESSGGFSRARSMSCDVVYMCN